MSVEHLQFFASCPKGLEGLLHEELLALGADSARETVAGSYFSGPVVMAYRACMWSRMANRILLPLTKFEMNSAEELYSGVRSIEWTEHWSGVGSLAVDFSGRSDEIRHTQFGAQKTKDAIVDYYRDKGISRPSVDKREPDMRINVRIHKGGATVAWDLGGDSLHRRGYRTEQGLAPLKENLAAAILLRADWPGVASRGGALIDPMCGAGTLLIEGAMMAADIAPGLARKRYGFDAWRGHRKDLWDQIREDAQSRADIGRQRELPEIRGYDADPKVIRMAEANIDRAGLSRQVRVSSRALSEFKLPSHRNIDYGLLICNPPYGERLGEEGDLRLLYSLLGDKFKQHCQGWAAAVFTGNPDLGKTMGLRSYKQYAFWNGALACKLLMFKVDQDQFVETDPVPRKSIEHNAGGSFVYAEQESEWSAGEQMFANRLRKNIKRLGKWLKKYDYECYRVYDADMPEYAVAVDVYGPCVHVAEYSAPESIKVEDAVRRLNEVRRVLPLVFNIAPEKIIFKQRRRQRGAWQYKREQSEGQELVVREGKAKFKVNLSDYLDTGLFLDHRPLRLHIASKVRDKSFLNLFCYTASVTVQAALGGARSSLSVDMSKVYLAWAKENFEINGIDAERHRLVEGNCLEWVKNCAQRFDIILLDPPSFSNSKKMEGVLDIQRDHVELIKASANLLNPGGLLYFSNNLRRFKLDADQLQNFDIKDISKSTIDEDFKRNKKTHRCWLIRHS